MRLRRRLAGLAWLVAALGAVAAPVHAREALKSFSVPEQPRETALVELARQAGVSLGLTPGARCTGRGGVSGRMELAAALDALLSGSGCVAVRTDSRTVVIRPAPAAASAASPAAQAELPTFLPLDQLVVTADRGLGVLANAPYGLTAVAGAELERQGMTSDRDLPLLAAGVTVTNLGPGRDKIILRGLSDGPITGRVQSTVGLYLGELRLTYNAPDPDLPLIDLARVEVLRGPQGSLYGSGSIGGVLQLTPNAPDFNGRSGRIQLGASATRAGAGSYLAQGVFNQPLGDLAVRVAAWREVDGGYIDNPSLGRTDIDVSRRTGVRVIGLWRAAPRLELETVFVDQTISTRNAHYTQPSVGQLARTTAVDEPHDNDFLAFGVTGRWSPDWGRLTVSLGAIDHSVGTTYDASAAKGLGTGGAPARYADENRLQGLLAELRLSSVGQGRLHWTLGAFNAVERQKLEDGLTLLKGGELYRENRNDTLLEHALYGEVSYDLTSRMTLTAGGRWFGSRLHTRSLVQPGGPARAFDARTSNSGFAPKLLLAYRPGGGATVYLTASEGYRTAGFNTAGAAGQAFADAPGTGPQRRYAGDELWSYEAGVRWRSSALGLSMRTAVFAARWRDIQANLLLPSGLPFTANIGDGQSHGVELEASWKGGPLSLSANLVRQSPELDRPAPAGLLTEDSRLPGVPELSYAATASLDLGLHSGWSARLGAAYAFVGHSRLSVDGGPSLAMGGYNELRLSGEAARGPYTVRLELSNALDRRGDTLAFGNPFSFRSLPQATPQRPLTLGATLRRTF